MLLPYPGSKTNVARDLLSLAPVGFKEYREPFCGNASMLWAVPMAIKRWINDIDPDLYVFLRALKACRGFVGELADLRERYLNATVDEQRQEFAIRNFDWFMTRDPASFWFAHAFAHGQIVSRKRPDIASFGSKGHHGNLGQFTRERMERARSILRGVKITNGDYSALLDAPGDDVWVYLDPPYYLTGNGQAMYPFDLTKRQHEELYERLSACNHRFLLTIGHCGLTHKLYVRSGRFNVYRMPYRYCSVFRARQPIRYELVVTNY
jgi:DNA adenine methylase